MLTFLYRDLDATDTDITEFVVLRFGANPQGMTSNAEERSVGAWDLQIEDDGVLDLHAQRTFYVMEDDTYDGDPVLWVGQTFDKHNGRGDTYRTGAGRVYTLNLLDLNTLLERRVIKSTDDPDRPEETDVERMLWLEGTGYIGLGTWISSDDPVDMDAVDYTGRMAAEVIEDCMGQSGKNAFMFRDPDTGGFSTFYGDSSADIDVLTSDIRISNVLADIDEVTTWEALLDADLWEANSRIYSGVYANYDGGAVYQENATTVANFSHRDTTVSWPDVKTAGKANARAIRYLADIGTEEYRITCNIEVPSDQVGFMPHAGYRLQARFSHYPLFTEFTWMRILSRATTLIGPSRYRIQYELSPGTPPPPPLACSTALAGASTYAPGNHTIACHDHILGPIGETVSLTPTDPSVIIAIMGFSECSFNPGVFNSVSSPYTQLGTTAIDQSSAGWKANTTSGGSYATSFTGGDVLNQVLIAAAFTTSATAPVQEAQQANTGGTATFPADLTPGNLLIAACMASRGLPGTPIGWTTIVADDSQVAHDSGHGVGLLIMARCVTEDDDPRVVGVPESSFAHTAFVSEWEVTS